MSVKILDFETWEYVHDDGHPEPHGGALDPATVTYAVNPDGSDNFDVIIVPCPFEGCGSESYWPPGGGADKHLGQLLHVFKLYTSLQARGVMSIADAADQVKQRCIAADGEERWVLDDAAVAVLETLL